MRCVFWGSSLGGLENLQTAMRVCGANVVVLSSRLRGTVRLPVPSGRHGSTVAPGAGADDVLRGLREQGGRVESRTYVKLLQRCMELRDVALGERVRDHIVRSGRQLNVYELNTLVKLYSLCGSVDDARRVFDGVVDKTVVSWNAMIAGYARLGRVKDAFTLFRQMLDEGLEPNTITYLTVLDACSSPAALEWGKGVHARALDAGFVSDFRVGTALVNMYVKGGSMEDARRVFDGLVKRDVSAFNAMIGGYAKNGDGDQAFEVFRWMQREGTKPNRISYLSILDACSGPDGLAWGKAVHARCIRAGLADDIRVATALLRMYTKCGSIEDARNVFDNMAVRDVVSWTVMIEGYAESGHIEDAFGVFAMMREGGIQPDKVTYMHVLNACASSADLKTGREVHSEVERAGFGSDLLVSTALIHMYAKCGAVKDARRVFDSMSERDVVSWSAMIGGYAEAGCGEEAFEIFQQMKLQGVEPERVTYINILNVCVNPGVLDLGKEIHSEVVEAGLASHIPLGNALINMYAKCGSIEGACQVFDGMSRRDVITWNAMIGGYAQHGCAREAVNLFERMLEERVRPNSVTFVGVLSACSRAGFVTEGRQFFTSAVRDHGIVPTMELYGCMVDLLGRAGQLEEAEQLINGMPLEATASIWSSLLGACRIHGNLEIAERAAERCLMMDPREGAVYVQLSHMYAAAGMWDNVAKVRKVMEDRGVKKEQGCTWIRIDGKVHTFVTEDRSHPQVREIYTELARLMREIKREGHVPLTENVLHDVGEQQKEEAISYHSEKLAIAYGIMSTPPTTPIHIYKNLRVCADCHSASKFISKVAGREIIARDASRFHHFKNGVCSCGDYW
ncbi:hypothetical protein M758_2G205300 [Ceratodon purpureus]|nr:hypothetical protein M758_2G205300 [Ceratodon purpureus]